MRNRISQREAHRLRKRVIALEARDHGRLKRWASAWPGGTMITSWDCAEGNAALVTVRTARMLGHAVVVVAEERTLRFYAVSL